MVVDMIQIGKCLNPNYLPPTNALIPKLCKFCHQNMEIKQINLTVAVRMCYKCSTPLQLLEQDDVEFFHRSYEDIHKSPKDWNIDIGTEEDELNNLESWIEQMKLNVSKYEDSSDEDDRPKKDALHTQSIPESVNETKLNKETPDWLNDLEAALEKAANEKSDPTVTPFSFDDFFLPQQETPQASSFPSECLTPFENFNGLSQKNNDSAVAEVLKMDSHAHGSAPLDHGSAVQTQEIIGTAIESAPTKVSLPSGDSVNESQRMDSTKSTAEEDEMSGSAFDFENANQMNVGQASTEQREPRESQDDCVNACQIGEEETEHISLSETSGLFITSRRDLHETRTKEVPESTHADDTLTMSKVHDALDKTDELPQIEPPSTLDENILQLHKKCVFDQALSLNGHAESAGVLSTGVADDSPLMELLSEDTSNMMRVLPQCSSGSETHGGAVVGEVGLEDIAFPATFEKIDSPKLKFYAQPSSITHLSLNTSESQPSSKLPHEHICTCDDESLRLSPSIDENHCVEMKLPDLSPTSCLKESGRCFKESFSALDKVIFSPLDRSVKGTESKNYHRKLEFNSESLSEEIENTPESIGITAKNLSDTILVTVPDDNDITTDMLQSICIDDLPICFEDSSTITAGLEEYCENSNLEEPPCYDSAEVICDATSNGIRDEESSGALQEATTQLLHHEDLTPHSSVSPPLLIPDKSHTTVATSENVAVHLHPFATLNVENLTIKIDLISTTQDQQPPSTEFISDILHSRNLESSEESNSCETFESVFDSTHEQQDLDRNYGTPVSHFESNSCETFESVFDSANEQQDLDRNYVTPLSHFDKSSFSESSGSISSGNPKESSIIDEEFKSFTNLVDRPLQCQGSIAEDDDFELLSFTGAKFKPNSNRKVPSKKVKTVTEPQIVNLWQAMQRDVIKIKSEERSDKK